MTDDQNLLDSHIEFRPVTVHYRSALHGAVVEVHGEMRCSYTSPPSGMTRAITMRIVNRDGVESMLHIPGGNIVRIQVFRGDHMASE